MIEKLQDEDLETNSRESVGKGVASLKGWVFSGRVLFGIWTVTVHIKR